MKNQKNSFLSCLEIRKMIGKAIGFWISDISRIRENDTMSFRSLAEWEKENLSGKEKDRLPRWLSGKESACSAEDSGSIPGSGRSPGGGNGNPLHSCLGNPMDRGAGRLQSMRWQRAKQWQLLPPNKLLDSRDLVLLKREDQVKLAKSEEVFHVLGGRG